MAKINNVLNINQNSIDQDNIDIFRTYYLQENLDELNFKVNEGEPFIINDKESLWIKAIVVDNLENTNEILKINIYKVINIGKGKYGLNNTEINLSDFELISSQLPTAEDITNLPNTQVIPIEDLLGKTIYQYINEIVPSFTIQMLSIGRTVFITPLGTYLFNRDGGLYGLNNINDLIILDFTLLEESPTVISKHSELLLNDGTNPHGTTKSDVGLSNVDDTSDIDKPISTATQEYIDASIPTLQVAKDGSTPIDNVNRINFEGATVTDVGGGVVKVEVVGGAVNSVNGLDGDVVLNGSNILATNPSTLAQEPIDNILEALGGNVIPLSGTEVGKPVTGPIESIIDSDIHFLFKSANTEEITGRICNAGVDTIFTSGDFTAGTYTDYRVAGIQDTSNGITYYNTFPKSDGTLLNEKSISYSTEEIKTGGTWIDGKPIYKIVKLMTDSDPINIDTRFPDIIVGLYSILEYTKTTD